MALFFDGFSPMPVRNDLLLSITAPSDMAAAADGGYTEIKLTWTDNSDNEDGFKIERSPDDAAWAQIDTVGAGVTYYTDTGLTRGNTYYYRVRAYAGASNSDYTASDSDTIWQLSDVTLYAEYDANAGVYQDSGTTPVASDGDPVGQVQDQTGNGYHITQTTAGAKPSWEENEINTSLPVIRTASGDNLAASTASDWTFLHNGTEFAVYEVWKSTAVSPDAVYILMDTGAVASADTGFSIWYDDRDSQSRNDITRSTIAKAESGNFEADALTLEEAAEGGEWHVSAVRYDGTDLEIWTDGTFGGYISNTADGAPSASAPTSALVVGARYNNTLNLVGDWARILIISGTVSDADNQAIQDYLTEEYGLWTNRWFGSESVVEHDTSGNDMNGFTGLGQAPNGDLIIGYSKLSGHTSADGDLIIRRSSDGGDTWGSEEVIWDYDDAGQGNSTDIWFTPRFTTIGSEVWMAVGKRESAAKVADGIGYFKSNDNGATWSGPTQLTEASFTGTAAEGGGILELASGDWLYPYYGKDSGDTFSSCRVLVSDDSGATWSALATIADGETDNLDYTEVGLVQISNGDVLALIREIGATAVNDVTYLATSDDDGATWSATSQVAAIGGLPTPLLLSTGEIISPQRNVDDPTEGAQILYSGDEGASWQFGWLFAASPNNDSASDRMTYGQFVEGPDGTIYLGYGFEFNSQSTSDVMFVKAG